MRIHILGICGTFMGGLALLARELGIEVEGSDAHVYPQPWLVAKLAALCVYIVLGSLAIRGAKTTAGKSLFAGLALLTFGYMLGVAFVKEPLPFQAFPRL